MKPSKKHSYEPKDDRRYETANKVESAQSINPENFIIDK